MPLDLWRTFNDTPSQGISLSLYDEPRQEPKRPAAYSLVQYLQRLVEASANLVTRDLMGRTLLYVSLGDQLHVVRYIIRKRSVFVDTHNANGLTPLL